MRWAGILAVPIAVLLLAAASAPQGFHSGTWAQVAELARPRAYATATLLPTGEILVFGGLDDNDPNVVSRTTEIVDPLTGLAHAVTQPFFGRLHHTTTFAGAADDRLVVAGGVEWYDDSFHSSERVDIFLPFEHRWIQGPPLRQARSDHGAARLHDGRVLVSGGNYNNHPLGSSELYDPRTDRWTEAAPLPEPRLRFSVASLPDGRVIAMGGLSKAGIPLASSVIYDPQADRWTSGPDMSVARVQQASVSLANGDVLVIGGQQAASGTAERYDVSRGVFVPAGALVEPRLIEQAAVLPDGRVLITGGSPQLPGSLQWVPMAGAEIWSPVTSTWSRFASPHLARALGDLVVARNEAFLIGGIGEGLAAVQRIERLPLR